MAQQTIVAHFNNRSDAQRAMDALVEAGIGHNAIRMLPEAESTTYRRTDNTSSYDHTRDEGGFWSSLNNLFLPDEDRYAYAEGMSRGGVTLSVTADEAQVDRIADIIDRYDAVDMDEREASWRSEGWTGHTSGAAGTGAAGAVASGAAAMGAAATGATGSSAAHATRGTTGDEVIPVVEEQLQVGKRVVDKGRVRIRYYVTEQPVQEQVSLRQEHVHVERRPVNRVLTPEEEERILKERTVEVFERSEEAVVCKEDR